MMVDEQSLRLDENDPDERAMVRGVVSAGRAVLDGMADAPRIREDDVRLQIHRDAVRELEKIVSTKRLGGVEELILLTRYLPESFVMQFLRLIDRAVGEKSLGSGRGVGDPNNLGLGARSGVEVKSEQPGYRGGADRAARPSSGMGMPIRSEEAMYDLDRYRKRLRGMAREIAKLLREDDDPGVVTRRRCGGRCKRLGSGLDLYCSNCGGPMEDVIT